MKLAFVIPWYGENIPGGAEAECRRTAEQLKQAGVEVEVLTTCVREFASDWSHNFHRPGVYTVNGVPVRRFKVRRRNTPLFDSINAKLMRGNPVTPEEEEHYIAEMINSADLYEFISRNSQEYVFVFIPYMFGTTYWGSRICPERSYIIPCLHDESYAYMGIYWDMFHRVRGLLLHSAPERDLAQRLYSLPAEKLALVGEGVDTDVAGNPSAFRAKYGIEGDFILYAGRKDDGKNVGLLVDYFCRFTSRQAGALRLVLIGSGQADIPRGYETAIVDLPFVPRQDKYDAYSAALALCQPSLNESFSLAMMEAWACGTPALVHAGCAVTRDHCQTANGGLFFGDYDEFEGCLKMIDDNRALRDRMGDLGRKYVLANYSWPAVVRRLKRVLLGPPVRSESHPEEGQTHSPPIDSAPPPTADDGCHFSEPLTADEIETTYWQMVRSQDFYDGPYAARWSDETPYQTIAQLVQKYYQAKAALDVGCGLGLAVKHLRNCGVRAFGLEFSDAFLSLSPSTTRRFLTSGDVTALPFPDDSFDLVICMEVLEHLPIRLVERAVQELRRVSRSCIFVTIPSYGPNEWGPYALPLHEQHWFEAARAGTPFPRIVLDGHNRPHCGHVTLASVRWWTETFLRHDLIRSGQIERAINDDTGLGLSRWHWNIYCLNKVAASSVRPAEDMALLGRGWTTPGDDPDRQNGGVRWTRGRAEVFIRPNRGDETVCLEIYSGWRHHVFDVAGVVVIEQVGEDGRYRRLGDQRFELPVDTWQTLRVPMPGCSSRHLRLAIELDEAWSVEETMFHSGQEAIGVGVRRVWLE